MKAKRALIIIPVAVAVAALVYFIGFHSSRGGDHQIHVSGNVEATEVAVSFRIPGRVIARLVDEGQSVKRGQVIARLDDSDLKEQLAEREAALEAARANLSELVRGYRPEEVAQGRANLAAAAAELAKEKADMGRARTLYDKEVISAREFDAARAAYQSAVSKEKDAKEKLAVLVKGPRTEQIEAARARAKQAEKVVGLAKLQLDYATLYSPLSGMVLSKNVEDGEYVQPGTPVITAADLATVYIRAYIEESDLGRVKLGEPAKVTTDSYPGKSYKGRVSFIASEAEFTPRTVQTRGERVKLVYRIKIDVNNPKQELKPGMPADAVLQENG